MTTPNIPSYPSLSMKKWVRLTEKEEEDGKKRGGKESKTMGGECFKHSPNQAISPATPSTPSR